MSVFNLDIIINLREPAVFAVGHQAGNLIITHDYIPGNVVLGAFANRFLYIKGGQANNLKFQKWFLSDAVRFENLYPCGDPTGQAYISTPIPLSTLTCKDYPGLNTKEFIGYEQPNDEHPYKDFLIPDMEDSCFKCSAPLKNREGFYYYHQEPDSLYRMDSSKLVRMHNIIDDGSQRPSKEGGGVFSFEALAEDQYFRGLITFYDKDGRDDFKNTLFGAEDAIELTLGKARRRGYGDAIVEVDESPNDIPRSLLKGDFRSRWNNFQQKKRNDFSITLHSDAIITNKFLCYHTTLSDALLVNELGVPSNSIELKKVFSRAVTIDGFSGKQGLPLEQEIGIAKGSAFLFEVKDGARLDEIKNKLKSLEESGIGFRRNEGFGRIIVCDGYHLMGI